MSEDRRQMSFRFMQDESQMMRVGASSFRATGENTVSHVSSEGKEEAHEVTADEIVSCYGKKRVVSGRDQCSRRSVCPWGEACRSRSNEEADDWHENYETITVGRMLYDPAEMSHEADCNIVKSPAEMIEDEEEYHDTILDTVPEEYRSDPAMAVRFAVEGIAMMYLTKKDVFHSLMLSIYNGITQSDMSRLQGVSRQCINQRLMKELGLLQKKSEERSKDRMENERLKARETAVASLKKTERDVYMEVFVLKRRASETAEKLGISKVHVNRIIRKIKEKFNIK